MESEATKPSEGEPGLWLMHFQIEEKIGKGAFGSVWKARDTRLDRPVAIKIPRKSRIAKSGGDIFLREARAAAQLKHPNIVPVFEVGKRNDIYYIVSDYIRGIGLDEWMREHRPTHRQTAALIAKLADALEHAHVNGVVHRDLKPTNILIDDDGEPHIMDFGLAKRRDDSTTRAESGRLIGTPLYMAPEQARGESGEADGRTDIYSLGVVFFELLTGQPPFHGGMRVLLDQILYEDAPSPRRLDRTIPRDLETICLKCLQKNRKRRYQKAGELAEDLRRWLRNEPIHARATSEWVKWIRWSQRNRLAAWLAASLLMVFLVGGAALAWQTIRLQRANEETRLSTAMTRQMADRARLADAEARAAESASTMHRYAAALLLANRLLDAGNARAAAAALDACPAADRGWEWRHLRLQCRADFVDVELPGPARAVAYSPRGVRAAVICVPNWLAIVDVVSGTVEKKLELNQTEPQAVCWCQGSRLALGSTTGMRIIDPATLGTVRDLPLPGGRARLLASQADGTLLATATAGKVIEAWDFESGKRIWQTVLPDDATTAVFHVDGRSLAVGLANGAAAILDAVGGAVQRRSPALSASSPTLALAFGSGRGEPLRWFDGYRAWEANQSDSAAVSTLADFQPSVCAAYSPNGTMLAKGLDNGTAAIQDTASSKPFLRIADQSDSLRCLAWSPGNDALIVGGDRSSIRVFRITPRRAVRELEAGSGKGSPDQTGLAALAFDATGESVIGVERDGSVWRRSALTGAARLIARDLEGGAKVAMISPAGDAVGYANDQQSVKVAPIQGVEPKGALNTPGPVQCIEFSPNGKWIAAGLGRGFMVWKRVEGAFEPGASVDRGKSAVVALAFTKDGRRLFAADADGVVSAFDVDDAGEMKLRIETPRLESTVLDLAIHEPTGRLFVAAANSIHVVDLESLAVLRRFREDGVTIAAVAVSNEGDRLAIAGRDGLIRIRDAGAGTEVFVLDPLPCPPAALAFSKQGLLVVGGENGAAFVLDGRP